MFSAEDCEQQRTDRMGSNAILSMRNLLVMSCACAGGYLLGSHSVPNQEVLVSEMAYEPLLDQASLPVDSKVRALNDFPNYDDSEQVIIDISPIMGDDGIIYDDDIQNMEDIIESLMFLENNTNDEEFVENLIIDQVITEVPEEDLVDPEAFLNEVDQVDILDYDRKLSNDDYHTPLACNEGIEDRSCAASFRSLIDDSLNEQNGLLVIPCGECFILDYEDGSQITLPDGLSIEGKLYIPSTASFTLRTKFVWVAGILEIETPDDGKQVKFSLYGDELQTYTAINPESTLCSGGCNMGSKVIAVVGGRLDIKGDANDCPAWEKLAAIGTPSPRPFDLPCNGDACWEDDTIKLRGPCMESKGHSDWLGKYTVYCPIEHKNEVRSGEKRGIKLTSIADSNREFIYPEANGEQLSLKISGKCNKAWHTNHFNKCVMHCPLHQTAVVTGGFSEPLTFTSVLPNENDIPILPPSGVSLRLAKKCWNAEGHTNAFKRCAVWCSVFPTTKLTSGENSGKLQFTSKFVEDPIPFPVPTSTKANGEEGSFTLNEQCRYMEGHSNAWGGCVILCPLENTFGDLGSRHDATRLNNPSTGEYVDAARILQYAHGGRNLYLLLQDVSNEQCSTMGAQSVNAVFGIGDEVVFSLQISTDPSANGNSFDVDQILHYSHNGNILLFFPSDTDVDTCDDTAADFNSKFPPGYEVEVEIENYPTGGDSFQVDKVHHWAWGGNGMYLFPEQSDVETCDETVSEFNSKFTKNFGVDVSITAPTTPIGQELIASNGVHHWSWAKSGFYFFPDESDTQINEKFPAGYTLKVEYLDEMDVWDIEVSSEAAECWKPGSEILLTSHTRSQDDRQVRTIVSSDTETNLLRLSAPINKPITVADSPDFAIEVARLNRPIVLEADSDSSDDTVGGHLIIHHTESPQHIEGVEIRNFGQQGLLGRYPLHFHKCGDSPDSLVRRNVVRDSNQRCYVTHLTNQVTLEENVALDAVGHCYFIEDGAETGNVFRKNLGSGIKRMPAEAANRLGEKSKRRETDFAPAVFWISNPQNKFYGNVAAGSQAHGYWYETHGDRRFMSFGGVGAFVDNEVHSSDHTAFTVYSPGWRPNEVSDIVNIKVYRNNFWGSFLHATRNLHFKGGIFADNGEKHAMISRGDDLVFDGTTFIGQSQFATKNCRKYKEAINLDPTRLLETILWRFNGSEKGTTIRNSKFLNWSQQDTNCSNEKSYPLKFYSHQTFTKAYGAPHVFENLEFDDPAYSLALDGGLADGGIDDVQIEISSDQNSVFTPDGSSGFLLANKFEHLVPTTCSEYSNDLVFCPDICIRTISVLAGNSAFFETDIVMVVTDEYGQQVKIERDVRGHPGPDPVGNQFFATYALPLPAGTFEIEFRDGSGAPAWPEMAFPVFEAAPVSCSNYVTESDITFFKPDASRGICNELIYNGKFDLGKDGWYAFHHGIDLQETGGADGSPALASKKSLNVGNNLAQYLDISCLEAGAVFDLSLSYKIMDYDNNPNPQTNPLPYVILQAQDFDTSDLSNKLLSTANNVFFHTSSEATDSGGWTTISGEWIINQEEANADKLVMFLRGGSQRIVIDNVSIRRRDIVITSSPSLRPSGAPSGAPTNLPTASPSKAPTDTPSAAPSESPTATPSEGPTDMPSTNPSSFPTDSSSMKELREQINRLQAENDSLQLQRHCGGRDNKDGVMTSDVNVRKNLR